MAHDRLANSGLLQALGDALGGLSDLLQKEIRLAKAEVTEKITANLHAGVWMVVAGALGFLAVIVLIESAIFAIASFGLAMHWACLLVAAVLGVAAAAFFYRGRSLAEQELAPRSLRQVARDIKTVKEQLT